jgi:hypothetical protein
MIHPTLLMNVCFFFRIYSREKEKSNDAHFTIEILIIREDAGTLLYSSVLYTYFLQFDILVLL